MILHAGLIALRAQQRWLGALITGPSGVGKTDLMLRALEAGFGLVADDRTIVWPSDGRLYGRAPGPLAGLLEARGLGLERRVALPVARVRLVVVCERDPAAVERLPEPAFETIEGVRVAALKLCPLEASAPAKLAHALLRLGWGPGAA